MKQKLLFLLTALMLLTTGNAWGAEMTTMTGLLGLTDNSGGFADYQSKHVTLAAGESYQYTFINYNKGAGGTDYWENWVVEANNGSKYLDFRADGGFWGELPTAANYSGSVWDNVSSTKTVWLEAYNGVTVTVTVSRSNDGTTFTVAHTATLNTSATYAGTYTATISAEDNITFYLMNEDSHQLINKVIDSNASGGTIYALPKMTYVNYSDADASYGEIAYGETAEAGYNSLSGTYPNQTVGFGNTGWGVNYITYINVDASDVPDGKTITSATLAFEGSGSSTDDKKSRASTYGAGYNSSSWSSILTYNTADKDITTVGTTYTTTSKKSNNFEQVTLNVTDAIRDDADKIVNIVVYETAADHSYIKNPEITVNYSNATLYNVTFTETSSVVATIKIGDTDVTAGTTLVNGDYSFTATAEGYDDFNGNFTVNGADKNVEFTMTAKPRYTFTVNAVDESSNVIKVIYSDADSYEGKSHTIVYPKYLTGVGNAVTHYKDNDTYGENKTALAEDETYTVDYTTYAGVAYFVEVEDVVSATGYNSWNCSNGNAVRGFTTARDIFAVPATGVYDITYVACNNNVKYDLAITLSKNETVIATKDDLKSVSINFIKSAGIVTNSNVSLTSGDVLKLTPSTTNGIVDYMLIELKSVSATIGSTGWTTFASAYPLNLNGMTASEGTVKAYYASSVGTNKIVMTSTDSEGVAAGTGLMLKGTAGATITIPVVASGDAISDNMLVGCTTETPVAASASCYVLVNNGGTAEFQSLSAHGATIPAGKAYLDTGILSPARLIISYDEEDPTGINAVEAAEAEAGALKDGKYLIGNKVVLVKNGMKYGANGQKLN